MPSSDPWFCVMNSWDEDIASCDYPQLQSGYIVTKKEEVVEESWMPKREVHFERITATSYM